MIVDDEAPARSELKFLLDELGQTEVVAEAASVREAIEKLKEYPCDVMFLDVNMPEATGLQLAEALQHLKFPPAVVFVTAYSEFALDAFKVNAIDYLVKPVETERLSQAISRVREHVSLHVQAQKSERIPVEKGGKKILIGIDKIRFVMARDDYAYLQTDTDRYFSTVSLAQLEKRLDGHGFFRVHRGYLVNLSMVEEIESVSGGTLLLTLNAVDEKIPCPSPSFRFEEGAGGCKARPHNEPRRAGESSALFFNWRAPSGKRLFLLRLRVSDSVIPSGAPLSS